jgi:hypothetical protein
MRIHFLKLFLRILAQIKIRLRVRQTIRFGQHSVTLNFYTLFQIIICTVTEILARGRKVLKSLASTVVMKIISGQLKRYTIVCENKICCG